MKIVNSSSGCNLTNDLKIVTSFTDQFFGLLRKSNPRSLLFKTRLGIHTFFLKSSIDVIVLDKDYKVVKLKEVLPNRLFFWNPKYFYILELPKGIVKKTKTEIGDILRLCR